MEWQVRHLVARELGRVTAGVNGLVVKPKYSPSMIANLIKERTSKKIREMFPSLEENYWNSSFWQDGYFVRTVGLVDDTIIRKYINKQRDNSARPF